MQQTSNRLLISIGIVVIWAMITIGVGNIQTSGNVTLSEMVTSQILWATPAAAAFLLIIVWFTGWRDLGFKAPKTAGMLKVIWLPLLYIIGFVFYGFSKDSEGLTASVITIVFINTMIVGFSEELAFRGILWGGARKAMSFWPAAILVSVLFGSVHIANTFLTGEFNEAITQAMIATMSGLTFLAIRIRTASLWVAMVLHGLWDFGVFLIGFGAVKDPSAHTSLLSAVLGGIGFIGPIFLFGLWLLRNEQVRSGWRDDSDAQHAV
ncbi:CPBP family intramembrane metalloprotease [Sphingorhabdus pulchriflava]|uniref:CPBP family intramembrane metalloprotease n=1 Tax=Sphingorhabdus pulchriflava TaxID=2292257 RepID=A0A371B4C9_9SPHN|nr:type II CAAX endopeptidase family protein [Sphingorhabdus pulchriflava]RDV02439.1 CPBP family intramembrane metalloprotease [Sphingorhabdus pulchriflava]